MYLRWLFSSGFYELRLEVFFTSATPEPTAHQPSASSRKCQFHLRNVLEVTARDHQGAALGWRGLSWDWGKFAFGTWPRRSSFWHHQRHCPYSETENSAHKEEIQVWILSPKSSFPWPAAAWAFFFSLTKAKHILLGTTFFLSCNHSIYTTELLLQ